MSATYTGRKKRLTLKTPTMTGGRSPMPGSAMPPLRAPLVTAPITSSVIRENAV
jgi:hypothetical protein